MKTIAFIPARRGSTRVAGKNRRTVGRQTLVGRAIDRGLATCDEVVVSTDCPDTAEDAIAADCTVHARRPIHAGEHSLIEDAVADWLAVARVTDDDVIAILQPTAPFVGWRTVRECIDRVISDEIPAVTCVDISEDLAFSGQTTDGATAIFAGRSRANSRPRTQDIPRTVVRETGGVYAFRVRHFRESGSRMADCSSIVIRSAWELFDIDTDEDLRIAEAIALRGEA